ncbi:hypothetical protein, partial [Halomicronema sp. CCY15110]|uniref:hypothetical protein n=1 Tax=Halomicronema sp. CCY15110 TaxID=2767773 RepID=UPI00194E2D67
MSTGFTDAKEFRSVAVDCEQSGNGASRSATGQALMGNKGLARKKDPHEPSFDFAQLSILAG